VLDQPLLTRPFCCTRVSFFKWFKREIGQCPKLARTSLVGCGSGLATRPVSAPVASSFSQPVSAPGRELVLDQPLLTRPFYCTRVSFFKWFKREIGQCPKLARTSLVGCGSVLATRPVSAPVASSFSQPVSAPGLKLDQPQLTRPFCCTHVSFFK
jgi:hypothetical protein